ncbi:MAG: ATP-dependent endonuclease [Acidimicrobiaceae bacterium]|nr:ATP-dependent endonuclease [Acidimicrobiaceae bacterium]
MGDAATIVLVEGVSDQIAVEALARAEERTLASVAVVPIGGAHGVGRFLDRFGPSGEGRRVLGLCDAGEEHVVRRAGQVRGVEVPWFVCHADLEDELIRAVTPTEVIAVLAADGTLRSFRTVQRQPAWSDRPVEQQLRRFLGSGSTRKSRYAHALVVRAVELGRVPAPLADLLDAADGR